LSGDRHEDEQARASERARRIGVNEAVFREVNERLEELAKTFGSEGQDLDLICECGNADCVERLRMSRDAYAAVRADAQLFVIVPGHEISDVEQVMEETPAYHVIKKRAGEPARVAEATDPRG
jgi:hypothetical protein